MPRTSLVICAAVASISLAEPLPSRASEYTAQHLAAGAAARTLAVVSGDIEYRRTSGNRGFDSSWTVHRREVRSGASYKITYPSGHPSITMNHDTKYMIYLEAHRPDGTVARGLTVSRAVSGEYEGTTLLMTSPFMAGGIWVAQTRDYVEKHADQATLVGTEIVDGVHTSVIEFRVSEDHMGAAFVIMYRAMRKGGGGILRLNVAPQLGFVVPKIEHVDLDGNVHTRFSAFGFEQKAPGLWFPQKLSAERTSGKNPYYCHVEIMAANLLNQPIDAEEFVIALPEGTIIRDKRSGTPVEVIVGQDTALSSHAVYEQLLEQEGLLRQQPSGPRRIALSASAALLLTALAVGLWIRQRGVSS